MTAFRYVALDTAGAEHSGVHEGESARLVRRDLRERGLLPVSVESVREAKVSRFFSLRLGSRLSARELQLFTRQLSTLLRSGLPLEEALKAIANQSESSAMQSMVLQLREHILQGHSLSSALAGQTATFDDLYRTTVDAGEASGRLDAVLDGLVAHLMRRRRLAQKTQAALIYPVVLTVVSVLVVVGLLQFVVPEIVSVFDGTGQTLPALTRGLLVVSEFLQHGWLWLLSGLLLLAVGARLALRNPLMRFAWHEALLKLPVVARFLRTQQTARLMRTLAILVGSGVPLLNSLKIAGDVLVLLPYRRALDEVATRVREGELLSRSLERTRRIPPVVLSLVASGEAAGNLADMMASAADDQEDEIESSTEVVLSLFEPLIILIMGGAVLLIVLAMLLPIFEMNQLIG